MAGLTPQGRAQVVLIEPADAMNAAAANALLKTPRRAQPGVASLLLVSAYPARLPPTIRSRCQRIDFPIPPADAAPYLAAGARHRSCCRCRRALPPVPAIPGLR